MSSVTFHLLKVFNFAAMKTWQPSPSFAQPLLSRAHPRPGQETGSEGPGCPPGGAHSWQRSDARRARGRVADTGAWAASPRGQARLSLSPCLRAHLRSSTQREVRGGKEATVTKPQSEGCGGAEGRPGPGPPPTSPQGAGHCLCGRRRPGTSSAKEPPGRPASPLSGAAHLSRPSLPQVHGLTSRSLHRPPVYVGCRRGSTSPTPIG